MELQLFVKTEKDGSVLSYRMPVNGRVVLGRGPDSPVPLDGHGISREHLAFEFAKGALQVVDLSSNGTRVNTVPIPRGRPYPLQDGDSINVPGYEIDYQLLGKDEPRPAEEPPKAAAARPVPESQPETGPLAPVKKILNQISGMEKFLILLTLAAAALVVLYLKS